MPAKIGGYSTSEPLAPLKGSSTGGVAAEKPPERRGRAVVNLPDRRSRHADDSARSLQKLVGRRRTGAGSERSESSFDQAGAGERHLQDRLRQRRRTR